MLSTGDAVPEVVLDPVFGRALTLPADLSARPLAVVFVGGLSMPRTRAILSGLQDAYADLDRAGVQLVAVTGSEMDRARDFVPRFHLLYPLVVDADGALRDRFGLSAGQGVGDVLRGWMHDMRQIREIARWGRGMPEAGAAARPAWFVLGVDGCVAAAHAGAPDPTALVSAACAALSPSSG